jgi:hypothetical protein
MNWMPKVRMSASPATAISSKPGPIPAPAPSGSTRISNGLKEFLAVIGETNQGRVLDLGQVSQATITFFIERGYRLSTEDMLRSWKEYLTAEEERLRLLPLGDDGERFSQSMLAEKFLKSSMQYPEENFIGVLTWDLFDYLDGELLTRAMDRIHSLLRPGGAVLSMFHSRPPQRFHRYRIVDNQTIELLPAPTLAVHARVMQNREILDTFGRFRSAKTFVGRDQLREGLFLK